MHRRFTWVLPALLCGGAACSVGRSVEMARDAAVVVDPDGGTAADAPPPPPPDAGAPDGGAEAGGTAVGDCPDLFTQDRLRRYELDIAADVWAQLQTEFMAGPGLITDSNPYHPIRSFRYDGEERTDVWIRLKGDSSWRFTITNDAYPKAQFVVAFDKSNGAPFHGVDKINFDMPQSDLTMMHERLAYAYERAAGVPAPCANNAELVINGNVYGLYVSKEQYGQHLLTRLFPGNDTGTLLKSGFEIKENADTYNLARVQKLWATYDVAGMLPQVDMAESLRAWAAEMMINDYDGYWGGNHNYYIYEYPGRGWLWMTDDADASFEWGARQQHPIYWWVGRDYVPDFIPQHYLAVISDDHWRGQYVDAIRDLLGRYDVGQLQGWIDDWGRQIADAVGRDPHLPFTMADHDAALARARKEVADRADFVRGFLACYGGGSGDDADHDGYGWCQDCDEARADTHPDATEICGDGVDQDCDGIPDDGCP